MEESIYHSFRIHEGREAWFKLDQQIIKFLRLGGNRNQKKKWGFFKPSHTDIRKGFLKVLIPIRGCGYTPLVKMHNPWILGHGLLHTGPYLSQVEAYVCLDLTCLIVQRMYHYFMLTFHLCPNFYFLNKQISQTKRGRCMDRTPKIWIMGSILGKTCMLKGMGPLGRPTHPTRLRK